MRKMQSHHGGEPLNIVRHVILRNYWEYYITDQAYSDDIVTALVMGVETEVGDVSLKEIEPHIRTDTNDLESVMPAPNWKWVE